MKKNKLNVIMPSFISIIVAGTPIHDRIDSRIKGQSFGGSLADYQANKDGLGTIGLQHHSGTAEINNELKVKKILHNLMKENTIENVFNDTLSGNLGSDSVKQPLLNQAS